MNNEKENSIEAIIDVGDKPNVSRIAIATGIISLQKKTISAIKNNVVSKGNVCEASTIAAIQAVKDTPRIIPHCHIIPIEGCKVDWAFEEECLRCTVEVRAYYRTGVEMEALTGVSAGLLCVFDMVKSYEKNELGQYPQMLISEIKVVSKKKIN